MRAGGAIDGFHDVLVGDAVSRADLDEVGDEALEGDDGANGHVGAAAEGAGEVGDLGAARCLDDGRDALDDGCVARGAAVHDVVVEHRVVARAMREVLADVLEARGGLDEVVDQQQLGKGGWLSIESAGQRPAAHRNRTSEFPRIRLGLSVPATRVATSPLYYRRRRSHPGAIAFQILPLGDSSPPILDLRRIKGARKYPQPWPRPPLDR